MKTEIKQTVIISKINNIDQFGLSWILFKQSVFSSQRSQYALIHFASFYRNFSLQGYHTIKVLITQLRFLGGEHTFCVNTGWHPAPCSMLALRGLV